MTLHRYRYVGPHEVMVVPLSQRVRNGDVVETEVPIRHPHFVPVSAKARSRPPKPPFVPHFPEEAPSHDDH